MAGFGGFDLNFSHNDLDHQLAGMRREAARLSKSIAHMARHTGRDVVRSGHHFTDAALAQLPEAARLVGRQARKAGRSVQRDPVPTLVAMIGVACLASLALSRTKRRR